MNSFGRAVSYYLSLHLSCIIFYIIDLDGTTGQILSLFRFKKRLETKIFKLAQQVCCFSFFPLAIFLSWGINFLFSSTACATFK